MNAAGNDPAQPTLIGKTAVVTGSSSGIGKAIALALAEAGANVMVHARDSVDAALETAEQIRSLGRESEVHFCDLASESAQDALADAAWHWRAGVDVWVNNAGVDVLTGTLATASFAEKLHRLWQVDVTASMRLSRDMGARMKRQGNGVLLNIGWDQAEQGMAGDSGELFAATKGAVMAFTRSLALSLAPEVRVNCIAPGWIKTAWGDQASTEWQRRAVAESQMQRWGTPEDIAAVACFLASPAASFVAGQVISVNGGWKPN